MEFTKKTIVAALQGLRILTGISKELYGKYLLDGTFGGKYAPETVNGLEIAGTHKSFPCVILSQGALLAARAVGEDYLKDIAGALRGSDDFADETRAHRIYVILPEHSVGLLDETWRVENFEFHLLTYKFSTMRDHLLQFEEIRGAAIDSPFVDFIVPPIPDRSLVVFYEPGSRVATLSDGGQRRVHISVEGDIFIRGDKDDPHFPTDLKNEDAVRKLLATPLTERDVVGLSVTTRLARFGSFKIAVEDGAGKIVKLDFVEDGMTGYDSALEKAWQLLHAREIVWNDFFETEALPEYGVGLERRRADECPFCGSTELAKGAIHREDATLVLQRLDCRGCGKHWHDKFTLSGWTERLS